MGTWFVLLLRPCQRIGHRHQPPHEEKSYFVLFVRVKSLGASLKQYDIDNTQLQNSTKNNHKFALHRYIHFLAFLHKWSYINTMCVELKRYLYIDDRYTDSAMCCSQYNRESNKRSSANILGVIENAYLEWQLILKTILLKSFHQSGYQAFKLYRLGQ